MTDEQFFKIFFCVWAVLAISSWIYFFKEKNIPRKTRNLKYGNIIIAAIFFLFTAFMMRTTPIVAIVAWGLAIAAICYINIKCMKICQHCGAFINLLQTLGKIKFCPKCGTPLEPTSA